MRYLLCLIAVIHTILADTHAAEPFFKPNDVVAFVGGEDMVVAAELGYLETLIQLALPDHHLKFRSLAREGDTVFEQRRDLNYPKLEDQLDKIGATVVICQFGQMESLMAAAAGSAVAKDEKDVRDKKDAGKADVPLVPSVPSVPENADATRQAKVAEFVAAYEKLIGRLKGKDGKRRIAFASPAIFLPHDGSSSERVETRVRAVADYVTAVKALAESAGGPFIKASIDQLKMPLVATGIDTVKMDDYGHREWAINVTETLTIPNATQPADYLKDARMEQTAPLRQLITAKNRLWYYYYRPQNWAFLAGDRTNQPSSRDHLDPSKRWFPEELEKFVPLIEAKDAEIWALAKKLAK